MTAPDDRGGQAAAPPTVYERLGGADGVRSLVDRAFTEMADHMVNTAASGLRGRT